eukprot:14477957-Alexandrium_andersonii.AAC.1
MRPPKFHPPLPTTPQTPNSVTPPVATSYRPQHVLDSNRTQKSGTLKQLQQRALESTSGKESKEVLGGVPGESG